MIVYTAHTDADRRRMLEAIGVASVEDLFADIPAGVRLRRPLDLPPPLAELELGRLMRETAGKNENLQEYTCFLGAGAYDHFIPSVVGHILSRSEFYTAYTPYQAEISQGVLQSIYEYQSLICELTGMDVANASMYDGASALAEAALLAAGATGRKALLVGRSVHPEYRRVISTYTAALGLEIVELPFAHGVTDPEAARRLVGEHPPAAVIIQQPNFFGCLEPVHDLEALAHGAGALYVVAADPISLGVLAAPAEYGADVVVGEGQALGNPISFGGPYLGFFAAREKYVRRMPGRIVGATSDVEGKRGYVLTLQTREQHIRREKATSNICSNEALNALAACVYLSALGKSGLKEVAGQCLQKAHYARERITRSERFRPAFNAPFFKEFAVATSLDPDEVNRELRQARIIGGYPLGRDYPELAGHLLFCVTEKRTREEIDHLAARLEGMI